MMDMPHHTIEGAKCVNKMEFGYAQIPTSLIEQEITNSLLAICRNHTISNNETYNSLKCDFPPSITTFWGVYMHGRNNDP